MPTNAEKHRSLVLGFAAIGVWFSSAIAGEINNRPSNGIVQNTKGTDAITYECRVKQDQFLECDFVQIRVRKKLNEDETKKQIEEAPKLFTKEKNDFCGKDEKKLVMSFRDVLEGRREPTTKEARDFMSKATAMEKEDLRQQFDALSEYCRTKTEENYMKVVRLGVEKESRTCVASANPYKQTFRKVADPVSSAHVWVAKSEPTGPCGIIRLDRFEPVQRENSKITWWNYISRKVVSNKKAELGPLMSCTDLDEDEYIYDWRPKERGLGCDYIVYSWF